MEPKTPIGPIAVMIVIVALAMVTLGKGAVPNNSPTKYLPVIPALLKR